MGATRTMVVWCPDWPIAAAVRAGQCGHEEPVAVFRANRVVAASGAARADGVRRAMRRREAQSRCPSVVVLDDDPARDTRIFEEVAAAVDAFTPRIEVLRPGLCQFPTRGPSRYHGGDLRLADAVRSAIAGLGVEARIGVADGAFAAALAARAHGSAAGVVGITEGASVGVPVLHGHVVIDGGAGHGCVEPGRSAAFLAVHPITALVAVEGGRAVTRAASSAARSRVSASGAAGDALALVDLVDLLTRLGITTLGAFAALPAADVAARFGPVGERAWRLASGLDVRPPRTRVPPPDLVVATEFDPPVERVDTAAFVAKALADEFTSRLAALGLACTRVGIEAETDDGVMLTRLWRHERAGAAGGLTPQNLAERVRWQLDGWLQRRDRLRADSLRADGSEHSEEHPVTGGIVRLRVVPDEVIPDTGRQLGLWGRASDADERAVRGLARVQGLLGPEAVRTPVLTGGRRPADLVTLVPFGDARPEVPDVPWPGGLPAPLPTVVHQLPLPCEVVDASGRAVRVSGRNEISSPPVALRSAVPGASSPEVRVLEWAGPWPLEERWWDLLAARRQARLQLVTDDKRAYVCVLEGGSWWIEGEYA